MPERLYNVSVAQEFEMVHVVRASSKHEARAIVIDLTRNRVDSDDPRLVESFPTGMVGSERVSTIVTRTQDQQNGSRDA